MRILVCEDNPVLALHLEMILQALGHEAPGVVGSASDCLVRCEREPPGLVLVDLDLGSGREETAALVGTLVGHGVPVVVLSSGGDAAFRGREGVVMLAKPPSERALAEAIEGLRSWP